MKFINKITISIFIVSFVFSGCTKKIEEAYLNPNAPFEVPPEELLAPLHYNMAQNEQRDFRTLGGYIQNWFNRTANNVWDRMGYAAGSDGGGDIWRMHYWLIGQNCNKMMEWATRDKKWDYVGAGQAIMAWSWLTLTDYHGDVILEEAFRTNQLTFKYDAQDQVYLYVRDLCNQALANLSKTGDGMNPAKFSTSDAYFYGGDLNKWKKFVYGVKARTFNHLTNKATYNADSVIYYCNLSIQTSADDATVKFANNGQNDAASFYGPYRGNFANFRQGVFPVELMTGVNPAFLGVDDPRKWYYFQLDSAQTTFRGINVAAGETPLTAPLRPRNFWGSTSTFNSIPANDLKSKYIFRDAGEWPIMTACEIQFMKAEAAFRKGDKPAALAAYISGITESFNMLTSRFNTNVPTANQLTPAMLAALLSNPLVVPSSANLTLTHIMLQKYIALWGYGQVETWVDMRRYHYLDLDPITGQQVYRNFAVPSVASGVMFPDNGGKLAYRVRPRYNSEYVWNIAELTRIGATQIDYHTVECWFSKP